MPQNIKLPSIHASPDFVEFARQDISGSIVERFERISDRYGNFPAVKTIDTSINYNQLNVSANQIARAILDRLGKKDEAVGLLLPKSAMFIQSLLGVLKSGKNYIPIDPSYPSAMIATLIQHSRIRLILTSKETQYVLKDLLSRPIEEICVDDVKSTLTSRNVGLSIPSEQAASIYYTSGSTGEPKGVIHNHKTILHSVMTRTNIFYLSHKDRLCLISSSAFAASQATIFAALLNGATLYLYDTQKYGLQKLLTHLQDERITFITIMPSFLRYFLDALDSRVFFPDLRLLVISGEQFYQNDVVRIWRHIPSHCVVSHQFASSETLLTSLLNITPETRLADGAVPVGFPVNDHKISIIDNTGKILHAGEQGEIIVESEYLSCGYLHDNKQTKAVFHFGQDGIISYRTGDRARYLQDGSIQLLGRLDDQVKLRGFRVELGEIEGHLLRHISVKEAAVRIWESQETVENSSHDVKDKFLTAYVVIKGNDDCNGYDLQAWLRQALPEYMIPAFFVLMESLPRTHTGKINRKALFKPGHNEQLYIRTYVAPRTNLERQLVKLWQEILRLNKPPGIYDGFIDLGGDSLSLMGLVQKIESELKLTIPTQELSTWDNIAELSLVLEKTPAGKTSSTSINDNSVSASKYGALAWLPEKIKHRLATYVSAWKGEQSSPDGMVAGINITGNTVYSSTNDNSVSTGQSGASAWLPEKIKRQLATYVSAWEGERSSPDSMIIGINTRGTRPPLFWVFQGAQEFVRLAACLGSDQPLYGMRSGHLVMDYSEENIQLLALHYVEEILALQLRGKFIIGGNCQGGRIALAIAQHLMRRHQQLALLCLLEWNVPLQPYAGPVALFYGRESEDYNPYFRYKHPESAWKRYFMDYSVDIIPGEHGQFFSEPIVQELAEQLVHRIDKAIRSPQLCLPDTAHQLQINVFEVPKVCSRNEKSLLSVQVINQSLFNWTATEHSGIMLGNRWLDQNEKVINCLDGRSSLPTTLISGGTASFSLEVCAPANPGKYILEIDLIEEGICWFHQHRANEFFRFNIEVKK